MKYLEQGTQENNLLVSERHGHGLAIRHVQKARHARIEGRLKPHRPEASSKSDRIALHFWISANFF